MKKDEPTAAQAERDLLVFDWRHREPRWRALIGGILLAAAGMLASFIIFRVGNPSSTRVERPAQSVVLLSPSSLAAQRLLDYANDQSYLLLANDDNDGSATAPAAAKMPDFAPSYKGFRLRPRDLGEAQAPELRPRVFAPEQGLLPPLTVAKPEPSPAANPKPAPKASLVAEVSPELLPRWSASADQALSPELLGTADQASFRIAVDAVGRVVTALPLVEPMEDEAKTLARDKVTAAAARHGFILGLRFRPQAEAATAPQWGVLTLRWRRPAAASL